MAPIRGESAQDKAQKLRARYLEIKQKASYQRVMMCLKQKPSPVAEVEKQLVDDGHLEPEEMCFTPVRNRIKGKQNVGDRTLAICDGALAGMGTATSTSAATCSAALEALVGCEDMDDGQMDVLADKRLDGNVTCYGDLTVEIFKAILSRCEPAACSEQNLRGYVRRGERHVNLDKCRKLVELGTGLEINATIDPQFRSKTAVINHAVDVYKSQAVRRLRGIALPLDLSVQGIYMIQKHDGDKAQVMNRFTTQKTELKVPRGSTLYVDANYSDGQAILRTQGGPFRERLGVSFRVAESCMVGSELKMISKNSGGRRIVVKRPRANSASSPFTPPTRATRTRSTVDLENAGGDASTAVDSDTTSNVAAIVGFIPPVPVALKGCCKGKGKAAP